MIGFGTFGNVKLARVKATGHSLAIKVSERSGSPDHQRLHPTTPCHTTKLFPTTHLSTLPILHTTTPP
jgi:hypothetical protein